MNYKDLNLSINQDVFKLDTDQNDYKITTGTGDIFIKKYLPIKDKKDLVEITLQKAEQADGTYNEILIDMYFNLHLVYLYTDIVFTDEDREDEMKLYDELESSGTLERILDKIPDEEYNTLMDYLKAMRKEASCYKHSAAAMVQKLIVDLPKNMREVADILKDIDLEKYQETINFAQHANGNRPIPLNNK